MCTAIAVSYAGGYFGRNLDFECDFGEKIVIIPRNFGILGNKSHYAVMGMAVVSSGYPLFFDGVNECGLAMAGLRFAGNAVYKKEEKGKENIPSFELIPRVLAGCRDTVEAEMFLKNANITDRAFSEDLQPSPLHWIIADKNRAITIEQTEAGLFIYENPVGVLTNNPEFPQQMQNLENYLNLSPCEPENKFSNKLDLKPASRGMGAIGLPGDWSSRSRFVKTAFIRENTVYRECEEERVGQIFHTLYGVYMPDGCIRVGEEYEVTNYTSVCNLSQGIYYCTTRNCPDICAVDMKRENLDGCEIIEFEPEKRLYVRQMN